MVLSQWDNDLISESTPSSNPHRRSVTISSVLHARVSELCRGVVACPTTCRGGSFVCVCGWRGRIANSCATPGCVRPPQAATCFLACCLLGHTHYTCSDQPPFIAKTSRGKESKTEHNKCCHVLLIDRKVQFMPLAI